jgi:hypothetical protein
MMNPKAIAAWTSQKPGVILRVRTWLCQAQGMDDDHYGTGKHLSIYLSIYL